MKWIFNLIPLSLVIQTSFAIAPVVMSGPVPAITNTYPQGSTTAITYTITNRVPGVSMPISVSGISGPVSRTPVANDCGNALPRGPSNCNIGITIAPDATNAGHSFQQTVSVDYQGRVPLTQAVDFSVPSTLIPGAVLSAVGSDSVGALLAVSNDGQGQAWNIVNVPGAPPSGFFITTSCTGGGTTANCIIFGTDNFASAVGFYSTNGAATWTQGNTSSLPANIRVFGTACSGTGTNMRCLEAGSSGSGGGDASASYSTDQGQTWIVPAGLPALGVFYSATCTGGGSSAVCMATGKNTTTNNFNVFVTINGGTTWNEYVVTNSAIGHAASCTGTGANTVCVVAGSSTTNQPIVATSVDKGTNWTLAASGLPATGDFSASSCSGSGATAKCIAAGVDNGTNPSPTAMIVESTDGGSTWQQVSITGLAIGTDTMFISASCSGSGADTVCIAAGYNNTTFAPVLAVAPNGGTSWSTINNFGSAPLPQAAFNAASCTGSGATAICIAAGVDIPNSLGLIVESTDGGNTWSQATIGGITPNSLFFGASGTGGPLFSTLSKYKV